MEQAGSLVWTLHGHGRGVGQLYGEIQGETLNKNLLTYRRHHGPVCQSIGWSSRVYEAAGILVNVLVFFVNGKSQ